MDACVRCTAPKQVDLEHSAPCWQLGGKQRVNGWKPHLSAAEPAASWSRCPAALQPGSWAGCPCCRPPAGGSAGRDDTAVGSDHGRLRARPPKPSPYLGVAAQRGRALLQGRRRARPGLMGRQTRVAVQLRAKYLREEKVKGQEEDASALRSWTVAEMEHEPVVLKCSW